VREAGRRLAVEAAALAFFALLAVVHSRIWDHLGDALYAHIDPHQDAWILTNVTDNLGHRPWDLFEGNQYFPSRDAVLFCDPLLLPSVLVAPLRLRTDSPAALYNVAVLAVLTLSGYGFWRLGREITGDPACALLAGVAIPYTTQLLSHLYQLNLLTTAGYPFLWLALLHLVEKGSWRAAPVAALAFALQAGTSGYHAFACAFLCVVVAAWSWRRLLDPRVWGPTVAAAAMAGALLAPYLARHAAHRGEAELARPLHWAEAWSVDAAIGLFSSHTYVWRGLMPDHGLPVWPGLVVFSLAAVGARRERSPRGRLLLLVAGVFFVLALGPELRVGGRALLPLPYLFLYKHLPLFGAARRAGFFIVPAVMALGLLAALGLRAVAVGRRWIIPVAVAAAIGESLGPVLVRADPGRELPAVYAFLQQRPRGAVLELPAEDEDNERYQWWSNRHRLPLANGVAAFEPQWSRGLHQLLRREWKQHPAGQDITAWVSTQTLLALPIRYLVMHAGASGYARSHVDATPGVFQPLYVTADGEGVYRIRRGARLDAAVRRRFRDDRPPSGLTVRAAGPTTLPVALDEGVPRLVPIAAGEQEVALPPIGHLRRGLHTWTLGPADSVELVDVVDR
jgi:hypothetical protein